VDATLISAPSSTKNETKERDPRYLRPFFRKKAQKEEKMAEILPKCDQCLKK